MDTRSGRSIQKPKVKFRREMKVLRLIMEVTRTDRVRNEVVRAGLEVESVLSLVERGQLRWFGHVKRMTEEGTTNADWRKGDGWENRG